MIDIKEELIKEIKELLKTDENENIDINPNYLNYFDEDELKDIVFRLIEKKSWTKRGKFGLFGWDLSKNKERWYIILN